MHAVSVQYMIVAIIVIIIILITSLNWKFKDIIYFFQLFSD